MMPHFNSICTKFRSIFLLSDNSTTTFIYSFDFAQYCLTNLVTQKHCPTFLPNFPSGGAIWELRYNANKVTMEGTLSPAVPSL